MKRVLVPVLLAFAAAASGQEQQPQAAAPAATAPAAAQPAPRAETPSPSRDTRFKTVDRLELGTTSITGNQELPKVMYVVPWKKADLGDLSGKPARSLIDEILAPVDRDVFRREIGYFETLSEGIQGQASQGENPVTPETARP
ncbi:MAG: hypothetical protein ACT4UQ_09230 [Gammaproteobacteria bacterium]